MSPTAPSPRTVAVLPVSSSGAAAATLVFVGGVLAVIVSPTGGFPLAVAMLVTEPRSTSACVTV